MIRNRFGNLVVFVFWKEGIFLFAKGDKVVYPMHGAGVIEDLQEHLVDGDLRQYYVLNIPVGNLKIKVSAKNAKNLGLREVYDQAEVLRIIKCPVQLQPINVPENWNQRYKNNIESIKSGKLEKVLDVYRNLIHREKERGLSTAEKKVLTNVKQILISELILTQNIERTEAEEMLAESYENCYN